jgi:UDP-GlcNAc3NAcA epimerase
MRMVTVLGARPQFVKASVVSEALSASASVSEVVVHTGQHFDPDMSKVFFDELGMPEPTHHLGIHGGHHGEMTGRMLAAVEAILLAERPDAVIVYGDTNSTLAGALAAAKLHIPVGHVEAGLRSFDKRMPEEVNRLLTDQISRWLFAPTETAVTNLMREAVDGGHVHLVGDVMYDACRIHSPKVAETGPVLDRLGLEPAGYVLATIHRVGNTDCPSRLATIVRALADVAGQLPVVWPVHPRARRAIRSHPDLGDLLSSPARLHLIDPVGYLDMLRLERFAAVVATDSGGVQKEAFFVGVPCVTLREETEWTELVDSGWNRLAPPRSAEEVSTAIVSAIGTTGAEISPYGDGRAAQRIVERLIGDLGRDRQ